MSTEPSGGKSQQVFGISLSKCLRHDAELNGRRRLPVAPSSESCLLDALSLQSANNQSSRTRVTSRLNAQQLYDEHYCSTLLHVPHIVRTCCQHLKTHGLDAPGVFRIAGSKSRVTMLRQEFDSGVSVQLTSEHSVHDVASLLKEYIRDLPEPLLTHQLFQAFLATTAMEDVNSRVSTLRLLVSLLPTVNRDTLWYLLTFLGCVAKHSDDRLDDTGQTVSGNKMDSSNLATVFGPNVLRRCKTGNSLEEIAQNADVVAVVKDLIDFHAAVFRLTKELYNEVLDGLSENGTLSCEFDATAESPDCSNVQVQLDTADSSEGSFRTSSSGSSHQHLTPTDVTAAAAAFHCHGNVDDGWGDWSSQRWRHWQQMTMMSCQETNELQTLV